MKAGISYSVIPEREQSERIRTPAAAMVRALDSGFSPKGAPRSDQNGKAVQMKAGMSVVMAGLVPTIPIHETRRMMQYWLYILASRPGGAIYVGVTNDLVRRVFEHKQKAVPGHTTRYGIDKLVYFERYQSVQSALQREKNIKHWPRIYKTRLIAQSNPTRRDLYQEIV
jgi:putative endonuclease